MLRSRDKYYVVLSGKLEELGQLLNLGNILNKYLVFLYLFLETNILWPFFIAFRVVKRLKIAPMINDMA